MLNSFTLAITGGIHRKDKGRDCRMQGEIQHWYGFHFPYSEQVKAFGKKEEWWVSITLLQICATRYSLACCLSQEPHIQRNIFPMSSPETTEHQVITLSQQTHKELLLGVQNPASTE